MVVRLPAVVAIPLCIVVAAVVVVCAIGDGLNRLERRMRPGRLVWIVRAVALASLAVAVALAAGFYFETRDRDAVYTGLTTFDLGEVIVVATCVGVAALGVFWARWRRAGALLAVAWGAALALKPFVLPITAEFPSGRMALSATSETHLYFLLSGLALVALGAVLFVRAARPVEPRMHGNRVTTRAAA